MKVQDWIFSVRYWDDRKGEPLRPDDMHRGAVVGPARSSTVEAALHLAHVSEDIRAAIRADETVRKFVEGALDPASNGYYAPCPFPTSLSWCICIGSVQAVLDR